MGGHCLIEFDTEGSGPLARGAGWTLAVATLVFAGLHLQDTIWPSTNQRLSFSSGIGSRSSYTETTKVARNFKNLSAQKDAAEVVQTGPGIPAWSGTEAGLTWEGPVTGEQELTLLLLSPTTNGVLAIGRVALLSLALGGLLRGLRGPGAPGAGATAGGAPEGRPPEGGSPEPALPVAATSGALSVLLLLASSQAYAGPNDQNAADPSGQAAAAVLAPSDALSKLADRLEPHRCADCLSVSRISVVASGDRVRLRAEVHASATAAWPLPGPATSWTPNEVTVDGEAASLRRRADGFVLVRLDAGVHIVEIEGPAGDSLALQFPLPPHRLDVDAEGWTVDGVRPDGSASSALTLTRATGGTATELRPRIEVQRFLDLGFPWRVKTTVRRLDSGDRPVTLTIPLLAGESVTDEGVVVQAGKVIVSVGHQDVDITWLSTLKPSDVVELHAPKGVLWTELWELTCSPVFACTATGIAPLRHVNQGAWSPAFRPWPGESVSLAVVRREAAEGQTITVDKASIVWKSGPRVTLADLELRVRSSQGGSLPVKLPPGASVSAFSTDGDTRPIEAHDGAIDLPLRPGTQTLILGIQVPWTLAEGATLPAVDIGAPAVNIEVSVAHPKGRWIVGATGDGAGPVPGVPIRVGILLVLALLAGRFGLLRRWEWVVLAIGLNQLPAQVFVGLVVSAWAISGPLARLRRPIAPLLGWAAVSLSAAIVVGAALMGLLGEPDMGYLGGGSTRWMMHWFVDRGGPTLPQPWVLTLPLWTWRAGFLVWVLWLVWRTPNWWSEVRRRLGGLDWRKLAGPKAGVPEPAPDAPRT